MKIGMVEANARLREGLKYGHEAVHNYYGVRLPTFYRYIAGQPGGEVAIEIEDPENPDPASLYMRTFVSAILEDPRFRSLVREHAGSLAELAAAVDEVGRTFQLPDPPIPFAMLLNKAGTYTPPPGWRLPADFVWYNAHGHGPAAGDAPPRQRNAAGEGVAAYEGGDPHTANPYPAHAPGFAQWRRGWHAAKRLAEEDAAEAAPPLPSDPDQVGGPEPDAPVRGADGRFRPRSRSSDAAKRRSAARTVARAKGASTPTEDDDGEDAEEVA